MNILPSNQFEIPETLVCSRSECVHMNQIVIDRSSTMERRTASTTPKGSCDSLIFEGHLWNRGYLFWFCFASTQYNSTALFLCTFLCSCEVWVILKCLCRGLGNLYCLCYGLPSFVLKVCVLSGFCQLSLSRLFKGGG